jgi:membrane protein implicated in regulation of membrane protease activity
MGFYFVCAVFGCTLVFLQFLLMLAGFGGGDDLDSSDTDVVEHSATADIFKVLSVRTIIAGIAFFGLGGLAGLTGGTSKPVSVVIAAAAGVIAIYTVYYLYRSVARLKSDGSISDKTLVGASGNVYLRIPAFGGGVGKVLVSQQNRTMEYEAVTNGDELKAGTPITVVRIVSSTTVEVKP